MIQSFSMKKHLFIAFVALPFFLNAQNQSSITSKPEDEIRQYFFVMLLDGKNRSQDSVTTAKIQESHMANINRLYYEGKLKVAGPFGDNGNWKGIFIFDCATKEEVDTILQTDPAVKSGRLAYEIKPWYTAAIGSFVTGKPRKN